MKWDQNNPEKVKDFENIVADLRKEAPANG